MLEYLFPRFTPSDILIAAAAIPALALLLLTYRADRVEKEPIRLLVRLALMGVAAAAAAMMLEFAGTAVLGALFSGDGLLFQALMYFVVVALSEEGAKYALLKWNTWRSPHFDCQFDGVVYAVFVSLGFALAENVGYVLQNGLAVAIIRALTAIPGHACFGVFMGCWYAQARWLANRGDETASKSMRVLAVLLPALTHGAYDFLASMSDVLSPWYFVVFVLALFIVTLRLARRLARADRFI